MNILLASSTAGIDIPHLLISSILEKSARYGVEPRFAAEWNTLCQH